MRKRIISFSGGASSFVNAKIAVDKYGKENVICIFCDTLIEDEDLYRFNEDAKKYLDCEFVTLTDGRTPWEVFRDVRYIGNTRTAHCSQILKKDIFRAYIKERFKPEEIIIYLGFDWTEQHRMKNAKANYEGYHLRSFTSTNPRLEKDQMLEIIKHCGIKIPRLYELSFSHNNCGGFCVRAGQAHFLNLLRRLPDVYRHHEEQEQKLMAEIPTVRPFLRKTINKVLNYITLKEFREMVECGEVVDKFDIGGCGCFVD